VAGGAGINHEHFIAPMQPGQHAGQQPGVLPYKDYGAERKPRDGSQPRRVRLAGLVT
jgi:hypothetical protein